MTVKMSISLTDQQAAYAPRQVEEGRFPSTSAVIQQALEAKRREDEEYEAWRAGFFEELKRRAEGPYVSAEEFGVMVEEMLEEERARLGLEG
ncbi:ribbon-helix-helix domain-containing protein [Sagittula salina]|uniref:Uncharacterized protein n=1 Tax=Sagittula salina TaxID=2820268 RepID=A0A940S236_9RHOB|nr:hypothetical protein [Sagittula salina]MBP0484818.1 hypothetical protein [Sagittula salina]